MSDLSLLWTLVTIVGSVFASVWLAAWRLKGHLTGAELAGVRAENAAHTVWRQYAEAQAGQLAEAKATNATLQKQIAEGANKEVLADTAASSSRSIVAAGTMITNFIEAARPPKRPTWETYRLQPIGPPEPPSKGLLDEPSKGLLE